MEILIHTQRTTLKKLIIEDAAALYAYRSLPEIYRFQGWFPETISDAEDFIRKYSCESKGAIGEWMQWGIYATTDGSLIGDCGYHVVSQSDAEIGYTLAPQYHGQGYATEIVQTLLDYLFETARFKNVSASTDPDNQPSIRVLEKTGFKKVRLLEKNLKIRGEWKDDLVFEQSRC